MDINQTLREVGLTESEIKVYLALLKCGLSSKGAILKEAKIAGSKIYIVLDKLIDKGLASVIIKNNVRHYSAASPIRLKDYLSTKRSEIDKQSREIDNIMQHFESLQAAKKTIAEIYVGWKGMETVYFNMINELKRGQEVYVLGASVGDSNIKERVKEFFLRIGKRYEKKGIKASIIFNENTRDYVKECEDEGCVIYDKKFLFKTTTVEIAISDEVVAIVILKDEPIVILVRDKKTAESFISYFKELWKLAKR